MKEFIRIHAGDNVVVALKDLKPGTEIVLEDGRKVTAAQEIPAGHKMAISDVEEGGDVIKYGARIGNAKEKILAQAKAEAETILKNVRSEADEIISSAKKEAQVFRTKGEEALRQASRDVLLSLRGAMDERIKAVALAVAGKELSGEALGKVLVHLIEAFLKQDGNEDKLEVLLDEKEQQTVENALASALDADLRARCQLSPIGGMGKGFKLVFSGDSVVYDFSDQALADTLASHLSGRLAAIVSGN